MRMFELARQVGGTEERIGARLEVDERGRSRRVLSGMMSVNESRLSLCRELAEARAVGRARGRALVGDVCTVHTVRGLDRCLDDAVRVRDAK